MKILGIEEHDLRAALDVANYAYKGNLSFKEGPEALKGSNRRSWKVCLGVEDADGPGCQCFVQPSWRGLEAKGHPRLLCYHAHRDFLYALFERAPRAWVDTTLAVYNGREDFVSRHQRVGCHLVGSFFRPVVFSDSCNCSKFPQIEELVPDPHLGEEYALGPGREIYAGLEQGRK